MSSITFHLVYLRKKAKILFRHPGSLKDCEKLIILLKPFMCNLISKMWEKKIQCWPCTGIYNVTSSVPSICLETQTVLPIPKWSNVLLTFTPVDLSYIYLLALSSSVLSIHWVEAVISGSCTRQIRCLDRAQHLSLLIGLRLYGIALEPTIKVLKVLIIKELKVPKNTKHIFYL